MNPTGKELAETTGSQVEPEGGGGDDLDAGGFAIK
jgi:hypothetical protein